MHNGWRPDVLGIRLMYYGQYNGLHVRRAQVSSCTCKFQMHLRRWLGVDDACGMSMVAWTHIWRSCVRCWQAWVITTASDDLSSFLTSNPNIMGLSVIQTVAHGSTVAVDVKVALRWSTVKWQLWTAHNVWLIHAKIHIIHSLIHEFWHLFFAVKKIN